MIGDLLCSVPAMRALRLGFPEARITLIGLPWARSFVSRFSMYLDDFIEFPGFPGLPEIEPRVAKIPEFLADVQSRHFDLAIQLHGSGSIANPIINLFGARDTAGFFERGQWPPDSAGFIEYPERETEISRFLLLMEHLGVPLRGDHLEFPLDHQDERDFVELRWAPELAASDYVCVHPGARFHSRRWQPEKFASVADSLAAGRYKIVLTGTAAEKELTKAVQESMLFEAVDLAGKTSLGALGVLLSKARLLVSNDTGVSHIAAALGTPSVVVVLGSDPARWQMYDPSFHRVVFEHVDCRPCDFVVCPTGHLCSNAVMPKNVLGEAISLLKGSHKARAVESIR